MHEGATVCVTFIVFLFYSTVPILTHLFYSCILRRSAVPFI